MPIDYSNYPKNWKTEIRPRILKRAKDCCEFCGVPNYAEGIRSETGLETLEQYIEDCIAMTDQSVIEKYGADHLKLKVIKIVLTIAHLDHDAENHDVTDERLKALCQRCHLRYDAPEKARKRALSKYENSLFPIKNN